MVVPKGSFVPPASALDNYASERTLLDSSFTSEDTKRVNALQIRKIGSSAHRGRLFHQANRLLPELRVFCECSTWNKQKKERCHQPFHRHTSEGWMHRTMLV